MGFFIFGLLLRRVFPAIVKFTYGGAGTGGGAVYAIFFIFLASRNGIRNGKDQQKQNKRFRCLFHAEKVSVITMRSAFTKDNKITLLNLSSCSIVAMFH